MLALAPAPDHGGEHVDVAVHGQKMLSRGFVGRQARITGSRRIDEDQVGEFEPAFLIVDEARRR